MHLVSDFCNRISQAAKIKLKAVIVRVSKIVVVSLYIVYKLGYINFFKILNFKHALITLKYFLGAAVIRAIFSLSTPSLKNYLSYKKIQGYVSNNKVGLNGFLIFSTNDGNLYLDIECILRKCGGKALWAVY